GRYLFAAPGKVGVLASALMRAVGKGHDNELFVLLADLLELADDLGPLLGAVKAARARHHPVLVICPGPPGGPAPADPPRAREKPSVRVTPAGKAAVRTAIQDSTTARFHRTFHRVRRTFARLGVPVLCARGEDPVRLILDRIERLRP